MREKFTSDSMVTILKVNFHKFAQSMAHDHCAKRVIRWICVGMLSILNANSGLPQSASIKSFQQKARLGEKNLG